MGNVNFENDDSGYAQIAENSNESFECAANLLKMSKTQLKDALLNRTFKVLSDSCTMQNDVVMATRTKKSMMKQIYDALFQFLIEKINEFGDTKSQKCISILDIAGFGKY